MKLSLKGFLALSLLLGTSLAQAGQQTYLSHSPNGKYRVLVEQVLDRRVGDKFFFRYPLILENVKNLKHHFEMTDGSGPLIQENQAGTFQVHWPSIHFEWSKDSLRLFCQMEVIDGTWKTFFVDVNTGKTTDITSDVEQPVVAKFESRQWDCEAPKIEVVKWIKPHLAFLRLVSVCGKNRQKENAKLFRWTESVLFDTIKVKAVMACDNSYDEAAATKEFEKYYLTTIPTPTPTPEETPTAP